MAPEDRSRIFDPFFTTKSQGTGLGLPVVHRIIARHMGTVEVESVLHGGTTFHVSLPLANQSEGTPS
jgi:signal transduction histidine kinase